MRQNDTSGGGSQSTILTYRKTSENAWRQQGLKKNFGPADWAPEIVISALYAVVFSVVARYIAVLYIVVSKKCDFDKWMFLWFDWIVERTTISPAESEAMMQFPNRFLIAWWVLLFAVSSLALIWRLSHIKPFRPSPFDLLLAFFWIALALLPFSDHVKVLGIEVWRTDTEREKEISPTHKKVRDFHSNKKESPSSAQKVPCQIFVLETPNSLEADRRETILLNVDMQDGRSQHAGVP